MKDYKYSFEKLIVWQKAREFVVFVYKIVASFPKEERYGLIDQIRRAAISVVANIAEGSSRTSKKDKAHFTQIAYSSLIEILSHFYIAYDLNYINDELFTEVKNKIYDISNLLNALNNFHSPKLINLSPITYHLSPITYHLSPITYHPSPILSVSPVSPVSPVSQSPQSPQSLSKLLN